jgi:TetR/AcrR family transcriptional regulator, transcriptional repressor for nem operon
VTTPNTTKRRPGRPPITDVARRNTRERLIRCGIEILTEQGFGRTGIEQVLARVGVPKGSFYHYFPSKEAFGCAVIEGYAYYFAKKLDRWLLDDSQPALQRLTNFIEDGKAGLRRFEFRRGCLIGNMGQELGGSHSEFRELLESVFLDWQTRIENCLELARTNGEIQAASNTKELAYFFWIGWEGAVLHAKLVRDTAPLDLFFTKYFADLTGNTKPGTANL